MCVSAGRSVCACGREFVLVYVRACGYVRVFVCMRTRANAMGQYALEQRVRESTSCPRMSAHKHAREHHQYTEPRRVCVYSCRHAENIRQLPTTLLAYRRLLCRRPAQPLLSPPRPPALSTTPTSDLLPCAENTSTKGPPCQACAIIFPLRQSASTAQHCLRSRETAQPEHFVSRWRRPRCSHLPCAAAASAQGQLRDSSALP